MSGSPFAWADIIGVVVGFLLTIMVLSYLFKDNFLFKLAMYILIGVSSGFAVAVCFYSVIWPQLILPFWSGSTSQKGLLAIPILLSFLLLTKSSPRFAYLGTPVLAFLAGIGAAAAIGGSVLGTILPQAMGSINQLAWQTPNSNEPGAAQQIINGLIFLVGSISTLVYFHFGTQKGKGRSAERAPWIEKIAQVGRFFITIAFGALFAGVLLASLSAMVERLSFLVNTVVMFIP